MRSNRLFDTDAQRRAFAPLRSSPPVAGQLRRYSAMMGTFLALSVGITSLSASAAEVSVRALRSGTYELVLTNPTSLSEGEARAHIAKVADSVCKGGTAIPGRWQFESKEAIGSAPSSPEPNAFRFVQEVSCVPSSQVQPAGRLPTLRNKEEARQAKEEVRLKSEAYFKHIASRRVDEAIANVALAGMGVNEARWKSDKLSFQAMAGETLQIVISKITVYDNPERAPERGLYVAADYSNVHRNMPIHCGYLMWFRPVGGVFRITREETGHVTAEQLKSIPSDQVAEIKRRLRCVAP
jgi:hypothetical protein